MSVLSSRVERVLTHIANCRDFLLEHPDKLITTNDMARWFNMFADDLANALDDEPIFAEHKSVQDQVFTAEQNGSVLAETHKVQIELRTE